MSDVRRILVIQLRELGDTILTTPLFRQLRRIYLHAEIDMVCQRSNRPLLEHHPLISETFELPRKAGVRDFLAFASKLRQRKYDVIVDTQSLPKTALLTRLAAGRKRLGFRNRGIRNRLCYTHPYRPPPFEYSSRNKLLLLQDERVDLDDVQLDFCVSDEDKAAAARFRNEYFQAPVVAIYGVTRFEWRRWPVAKLANIADRLAERGFQPFLVYGPGEESIAREIADQMRCEPLIDYAMPSIPVLKEILTGCELLVGNDGGPKHFANAAGIPTVVVMDGESAVRWTPANREDQRVVRPRADVPRDDVCGNVLDVNTIAEIDIDAVWKQIEELAARDLIQLGGSCQQVA